MPICDGCGALVDAEHIRQRIERLELSTRFRPIHIQVLLVDAAPPPLPEDFLYRATEDRSLRSPRARAYFDDLARAAGMPVTPELDENAALADFQRRGFFLVSALECPAQENVAPPVQKAELEAKIEKASRTVVARIKGSYKPKNIALLSPPTAVLIPVLQAADWSDRLILDAGSPFIPPFGGKLSEALLQVK
jgi:hypothetical protein